MDQILEILQKDKEIPYGHVKLQVVTIYYTMDISRVRYEVKSNVTTSTQGVGYHGTGTGTGKSGNGGKKLGHRRVGDDGFVTYKRFETSQLIGSIQLGMEYVFTNEANFPDRDLLYTVSSLKGGFFSKRFIEIYTSLSFRQFFL